MSISATDLFGEDIALDADWQPIVLADGTLSLCAGTDTATQDIALRLYTMLGTLFYDVQFGSQVMLFVRDESTPLTRAALCAEVTRRINNDPAVKVGSATCTVRKWDDTQVQLSASFVLITDTHPSNMVFSIDVSTMALRVADVVADVDPR
jgi:hypothetical protein